LIIVALVGADLHIRIFDASGKKVVDKAESELISGEILTALKKRLNPFPGESSLSKEDKQEIIRNATSIAGHTQEVPVPNLQREAASRKICREIWDPIEYITVDSEKKRFISKLIFWGPLIVLVALMRSLAKLGMKRLIYPPNYFCSRFEDPSKDAAFNYAKWYGPPAFVMAYPLWYWFVYDGNGINPLTAGPTPMLGLVGLIVLVIVGFKMLGRSSSVRFTGLMGSLLIIQK
jgi:hypothetical protein